MDLKVGDRVLFCSKEEAERRGFAVLSNMEKFMGRTQIIVEGNEDEFHIKGDDCEFVFDERVVLHKVRSRLGISLNDFFNSKEKMAVCCDTLEEANMFVKKAEEMRVSIENLEFLEYYFDSIGHVCFNNERQCNKAYRKCSVCNDMPVPGDMGFRYRNEG